MQLDEARGFVFDLDGTLIRRAPDGAIPMPGAAEVVAAIRSSGRPLVIFTNASHVSPSRLADGVRRGGLEIADDEVLTPVCSGLAHLARRHPRARVLVIGTPAVKQRIVDEGVHVLDERDAEQADVVLVLHVDELDLAVAEGAARAVMAGATFLTANYQPAYAGADGPILSRGAMVTAAIAKAASRRPTVVGKPSKTAVRKVADHLGVAFGDIAVIGDDIGMDIALGRLGGARTVLVRSGIGGGDLSRVPASRHPDLVVDGVEDLLGLL